MYFKKKRRLIAIAGATLLVSLLILTASVFLPALVQAESGWSHTGSDAKELIPDVLAVSCANVVTNTGDGIIPHHSNQSLTTARTPASMVSYEVFFTESSYSVNGSGADFYTTINISPIELFFGAQFVLEWDCTLFGIMPGWTQMNGEGQLYNGSSPNPGWNDAASVGVKLKGDNPQCPDPTQGRANFLIDWGNYVGLTRDGLGVDVTREGTLVTVRWRTYSDSEYRTGVTDISFAPTLKLVGIDDGAYEYTGTVSWAGTSVATSGTDGVTPTPISTSTPTPTPASTVSPMLSPTAAASPTPTVSLTPAPKSTATKTTPPGYGSGEISIPEDKEEEAEGETAEAEEAAEGDEEIAEENGEPSSPKRISWLILGAIIALSLCLLIVVYYVVRGARRKWSLR